MKCSFSIVHPQGTHVNITEVCCEQLDFDSSGTHVKVLTQGVTPPIVILCARITSFSGVNVHDTRFRRVKFNVMVTAVCAT